SGSGAGEKGPSIAQFLELSDSELGMTQGYIQWIFPMRQPSRFVANAPVLTSE
ncbi:unnamed protein product, partial [Laminaria digitata]